MPIKALKNTHTPNTRIGMGTNYGQAIKQKVGKMRSDYIGFNAPMGNKIKTPPKSLA